MSASGPPLFSTPGRLLALLLEQPGATLRELARYSGRTERAVWRRLNELEAAGLLQRERRGRRTQYSLDVQAVRERLHHEGRSLLALSGAGGSR